MATFVIPNTSKISAVSVFIIDGEPIVSHGPIVGWVIDDDAEKNEFMERSAAPVLLEDLCANETVGLLLEDGRVMLPMDREFKDVASFAAEVAHGITGRIIKKTAESVEL